MRIVRKRIIFDTGYIKIRITSNNVFATLTDGKGNVLISKHSGILRFRSSKKKTPYAGGQVVKSLIRQIYRSNFRIRNYIVQVFGFIKNSTVNSAIRSIGFSKIRNIIFLENKISHSHNGLRAKKKRRL